MSNRIKFLAIATTTLAALLSGCAVPNTAIPQDTSTVSGTHTVQAKVSTCDRAREAFLTGTQTDIDNAMHALIADKTAPATAREYAQYYIQRDATDSSMREMDKSLIQTTCEV
jgi:hypothetical protein